MSVNSSNASNHFATNCFAIRPSSFIYAAFFITNTLLLLPLCIITLRLGLHRWLQQRSTNRTTTNHSDVFTYHQAAIDLIGTAGHMSCCYFVFVGHVSVLSVGIYLWSISWYGELYFHLLTCVERYLAVVHPVTYRALRGGRGTRIRNIGVGSVWLLSLGGTTLIALGNAAFFMESCVLVISLIVTSVCSLSVLRALIRPGPGDRGGDREKADQSKQRAFYIIVAILGGVTLRFSFNLIWDVLILNDRDDGHCVFSATSVWLNLPGSLMLPLLFLYRAGRKIDANK